MNSESQIIRTEYSDLMKKSYIDYAMSVIISRALPDVRDGLKPVQRRTLYDMYELGIRYDKPYRKCARIVGDTMGKYHPHGDSSIYEALVVMAQEFKKGITLVDGHGNFGSIEGDGAAAMRYTEARLQKVSEDVLLADLDKAEKFIFLEFFILRSGKMWDGVEAILRRKAAQGVDVRLIYDDFGSLLGLPSDFVIRMEKVHIRCIPFNPVVPLVSLVMNHRDHRKIVVIDGRIAYTGGVNLADEYINAEQRFGYWKDAALRIEGDAAWNFTVMFLNFWNAFRPSETDYSAFRPQHSAHPVQDGIVQPYADSPLDEEPVAETVYLNLLARAEQYVYIYTPYLAVGEEMLDALKNAAKRGVDVRLVLPGIPDKKLVFRLSRSYYLPLLQAGVRIYEYTPGFLHAKCWVSDDRAAVVGSINMDYRSLFLHFECGVLLQHNSQVAALRDDVRATLPQCREIHISDCRTSIPGTLLDSVLRLLSPLM